LIEVGLDLKAQLLAGAAIVALVAAGPALAADLPLKAPPPVVAAWNWSGFYIGGHGGYGWGHDAQTDVNDPFFTGKFPGINVPGFDPKGYLGGVQAGANWQTGSIVAGLEGDISFTNIKGSSLSIPTPGRPRIPERSTCSVPAAAGSAISSPPMSCSMAPAAWHGRVSSRTRI
jgi:outer membrane immunogenic protein